MTVFGWDASDYDWMRQPLDLVAARAAGVDFFTHKATEGSSIVHDHYGEAMDRAREAGIPLLGPYAVPRTPGNYGHGSINAQVGFFLAYCDRETPWWRNAPNTFVQVDLEHWGYDSVSPATGKAFADAVVAATGKRVIMYAPQWAYGNTLAGIGYPLWASRYGTNGTGEMRTAYPGDSSERWSAYSGQTPAILQYGSRLRVGSQPACDANAFRGTLRDLMLLLTPKNLEALPMLVIARKAEDRSLWLCDGVTARPIHGDETGREYIDICFLSRQGAIGPLWKDGQIWESLSPAFGVETPALAGSNAPASLDVAAIKTAVVEALSSLRISVGDTATHDPNA